MLADLPKALSSSDEYLTLSEEQRKNLISRLQYYEEISKAGFALAADDDTTLVEAIDDIELDGYSIVGGFSSPRSNVTPYIIHSSWTAECDCKNMASMVVKEAEHFLKSSSLHFQMSDIEIKNWARDWAIALELTLKRFTHSESFTEAIVQLIVADALVASSLAFSATARISAKLLFK
jgi:hypothetical protein